MELMTIAALVFLIHGIVASIDGVYFHLHKYKLYAYPDTFEEHITHTFRAVMMTLASCLLFIFNVSSCLLWAAVGVMIADLIIQSWDVLIERRSRVRFGGLSSLEYLVHANAIVLYSTVWVLVFVAKPLDAWELTWPVLLEESHSIFVKGVGWVIGVSSFLSTIQHLWYCQRRYRQTSNEESI